MSTAKDWSRVSRSGTGASCSVWFEAYDDLQEARRRELQMKEWKRAWKIRLIEETNFEWSDLYPTLS